jgi:hypothetical protein
MTLIDAIYIIEGLVDATFEQELQAWSYIGKTKAYLHLQGFYGRTLRKIVKHDYLDNNFNIITKEYGKNDN